ncbi:UNVERIFIED_CONTAM: hypothetical protein PYX00_002104 [Menopon gallinae]|uniref:Ionotropic receptor 8a n=1 Tax=Menopon gallinae TaxID=328185 RepID=A0AAW2IGM5_9NEOP
MAEQKYSSRLRINMDVIPLHRHNEDDTFNAACGKLKQGVTAILDLTWSGWFRGKELAQSVGIPFLRVDVTISPFVKIFNDFLTFRNGTDAALIFENENELDQALYYMIGNSIIRVVVLDKLSQKNVKGLFEMRPTPSFHAVFASTDVMIEIYKNATEGQLVQREGRWLLIFTDFDYDRFDIDDVTVPTNLLTMKKDVCCHLLGTSEDCTCPKDFKIIQALLQNFGVLLGDILNDLTAQAVSIEPMKIDCDTAIGEPTDNTTARKFVEAMTKFLPKNPSIGFNPRNDLVYYKSVINIKLANKTENKRLSEWTTETEKFSLLPGTTMKVDKRFFRIGVLPNDIPWSYKVEDPETGEMVWTGYCVDLAYKLSEMMNFDFEFSPPKSGDFGVKQPNGKWDGLVGDLARGETDIVVAAIMMTSEREEVIDFVAPYFDQSGISIMIRKPVRPTSLFKFMTVLRTEVWVSIVGALTVTGIMIWLLDKYSPYSARNNKQMYPYPCREFTLKESFWFALTSFTPQGGGEAPKALSGRTLVAAYWLFVVLMLATFTANLAAFLTVERMKSPVESLEQLARQSRINYTVVKDSDAHNFFRNMKKAEDTLYRMWKELTLNASSDQSQYRVWDYPIKEQYGHILLAIDQTGPVQNQSVGIQKVLESEKGEFAFIHDSSAIKYEVYKNCNLTEVGEVFAERPYAVAVQQGSQLQEEISRRILDLQKDRYFETQTAKYWNSSAGGNCPNTDDSEGITLGSLGGVFIATLFGLALAMVTLAGEIFYHKHKNAIDSRLGHLKQNKRGKRKIDAVQNPVKMLHDQPRQRLTLRESNMRNFRPVGPGKMMPRVSYISVFPRDPQPPYG